LIDCSSKPFVLIHGHSILETTLGCVIARGKRLKAILSKYECMDIEQEVGNAIGRFQCLQVGLRPVTHSLRNPVDGAIFISCPRIDGAGCSRCLTDSSGLLVIVSHRVSAYCRE
jgi:hypothetical protein